MKLVAVFAFVSCCAFGKDRAVVPNVEAAACGPRDVQFEVKVDRSQHPLPEPPDGKALVYVVSQDLHNNIGVDGKWVGANDSRTYFFVEVEPGVHHLCAYAIYGRTSWLSLHSLQAKAGDTYYFLTFPIGNGGPGGRYSLEQLDPDEGQYLVSKNRFATSHAR